MLDSKAVIELADKRFSEIFGRSYGGLIDTYKTDDAEYILITFGSITGLVREVVDELRAEGRKVGLVKLRYLRPFPDTEIAEAVKNAKAVGTLEKDISFGYEGTVYTNVNSALIKNGIAIPSYNFIAGLGGRDISKEDIFHMFEQIEKGGEYINFVGLGVNADE